MLEITIDADVCNLLLVWPGIAYNVHRARGKDTL